MAMSAMRRRLKCCMARKCPTTIGLIWMGRGRRHKILRIPQSQSSNMAILAAWRITSADRYLAVLPLFHVHGLANGVCAWLASGCRMRLVRRFERDAAAALFDAFQPTLFFAVPTIYVRLLDLDAVTARRIGAGMRLFVSGSAPLPAAVLEAFRDRFWIAAAGAVNPGGRTGSREDSSSAPGDGDAIAARQRGSRIVVSGHSSRLDQSSIIACDGFLPPVPEWQGQAWQ